MEETSFSIFNFHGEKFWKELEKRERAGGSAFNDNIDASSTIPPEDWENITRARNRALENFKKTHRTIK